MEPPTDPVENWKNDLRDQLISRLAKYQMKHYNVTADLLENQEMFNPETVKTLLCSTDVWWNRDDGENAFVLYRFNGLHFIVHFNIGTCAGCDDYQSWCSGYESIKEWMEEDFDVGNVCRERVSDLDFWNRIIDGAEPFKDVWRIDARTLHPNVRTCLRRYMARIGKRERFLEYNESLGPVVGTGAADD